MIKRFREEAAPHFYHPELQCGLLRWEELLQSFKSLHLYSTFRFRLDLHVPYYERTLASLQSLDVQRRRQRLLQLLGLGSVVDNQGVLVTSASDLELGLLEGLAVGVDLLVDLDNAGLDV